MHRWLSCVCGCVLALLSIESSYACSAGLDFDPVAESDIIVGGRVAAPKAGALVPIEVMLAVDTVFKGEQQGTLAFVDGTSLQAVSATETIWMGDAGLCGAFRSDPQGQYGVFGLVRQADGTYRANLLRVFFLGQEPAGADYRAAQARLARVPSRLPATSETSTAPYSLPIAFDLGCGMFALGYLLRSRHS